MRKGENEHTHNKKAFRSNANPVTARLPTDVNRQTHATQNIPFPQLRWRTVIIKDNILSFFYQNDLNGFSEHDDQCESINVTREIKLSFQKRMFAVVLFMLKLGSVMQLFGADPLDDQLLWVFEVILDRM